nr:ribonuclease H-like domain-containing protein [Tanacetum cinerariifolium]
MHYHLMRIVILNGDSPAPTRVIEGVVQPVAPTTAKQRLARKNELKARGTLLMALHDKHQLKFNIHKDAKTLMEEIEKRFGGNKKTKKKLISQLEILGESLSQEEINLKFLRSLPTEWRTHTFIWRNKTDLEEQSLDDLFNSLKIYKAELVLLLMFLLPQLDNDDLKQIDADDLEEIDLKWQMARLIVSARRFLQRTRRNLGANGPTSMGFDMSKVEFYNCHKKGHFARECRSPKDIRKNAMTGVFRLGYNTQVFTRSMFDCDEYFACESDESLPPSPIYDRYQSGDGYHAVPPPYTGTFVPPKPDLVFHDAPNVNETAHTAFDVEVSPTKPNKDLSYTHRPLAHIIKDWVSYSEDDSEAEIAQNGPSFVQPTKQVKTPRPSVQTLETSIPTTTHRTSIPKPKSNGNHMNRKACFVLLTKSKLVPITAARPVTTAVLKSHVTRLRPAKPIVTEPHSPPRRHTTHSPSPKASNFPLKVTVAKVPQVNAAKGVKGNWGNPQHALKEKGVIDSGCSRHMTGNMSYRSNFEELNDGYVAFCGNPKGGKIYGKGKIRTCKLDFDDIYFVKELKFNLFSVSQMCDRKNSVLFTDTECLVLSPEFKLPNENQVLLRVPWENNMYNVDLNNIVPSGDLTCLFAKATLDESNLWHRRLGRINFKTINKLVKGNLIRGLPTKVFKNDHTCVACKKGKQHRASCKTKPVSSINQPIQRSDNGTELKNNDLNQFRGMKGIKREFSVPSTPQQNGIAERKNKTLIEAARTMLADSLLPIPFWAKAVNTACVQEHFDAEKAGEESVQQYVLFPVWSSGSTNPQNTNGDAAFEVKKPEFEGRKPQSKVYVSPSNSAQTKKHDDKTKREAKGKSPIESSTGYRNLSVEFEDFFDDSINEVNAASSPVPAVGQISTNSTNTFSAVGPSNVAVSPTHGKSLYMDTSQYPDDPNMPELEDITYSNDEEDVGAEADFTNLETSIIFSPISKTRVHKDYHVTQIIGDLSSATETRSMLRVAQDQSGLSQINNDDFHTFARIEAIRLFLAYASFMGFMVYQMDVKNDFMYGTIEEQVYVCQPLRFEDPDYLDKVYKVVKALYGLHQAPRAWYETLANYLLDNGLQVKQKHNGIFISQDKYVAEILRKYGLTDGKSSSTPIDTEKPLLKDPDGEDLDMHTYRSMIGSSMYLTSSRPDIMFAVCACARFQVTLKVSHLLAVKRIFRYLKSKPHLGLWYSKDLPFNLVAYSDSDYVGASLDRKSTTGGCQFLGCRLIS